MQRCKSRSLEASIFLYLSCRTEVQDLSRPWAEVRGKGCQGEVLWPSLTISDPGQGALSQLSQLSQLSRGELLHQCQGWLLVPPANQAVPCLNTLDFRPWWYPTLAQKNLGCSRKGRVDSAHCSTAPKFVWCWECDVHVAKGFLWYCISGFVSEVKLRWTQAWRRMNKKLGRQKGRTLMQH